MTGGDQGRAGVKRHRPAGFHWDRKERVILPDGRKSCRWCKGPIGGRRQTFCGAGKAPLCPRCGFFPDPVPGRPALEHPHRIEIQDGPRYRVWGWRRTCPTCQGPLANMGVPVEPCVHAWRLRTDPGYYSVLLFLRDRGVCAPCGLDCTGAAGREADHAIPLIEGGSYELENLRTLCIPCHKAETRALAGRRAKARRLAKGGSGSVL